MDYFYLSKKETSENKGAKAMSTKGLQKKLRDLGKSHRGSRPDLVQIYEKYAPPEEQEELDASTSRRPADSNSSSDRRGAHASEHPTMVMVGEATGNRALEARLKLNKVPSMQRATSGRPIGPSIKEGLRKRASSLLAQVSGAAC